MFSLLKNEFVIGWKNIISEDFVGESHGYSLDDTSVGTTNGAGPRNVQIFILAPDLTVLHVLPGFWHPQDFAAQLRFAQRLLAVWQDENLTPRRKNQMFRNMQMGQISACSAAMTARSGWQGFDAKNEQKRLANGIARDTFVTDAAGNIVRQANGNPQMKPINLLVHERMAARPFVPFAEFDTPAFTDYGRVYYDNNKKVDGEGEMFLTPRVIEKQKAQEARARQREQQLERQRQLREERRRRQLEQRNRENEDRRDRRPSESGQQRPSSAASR